METLKKLKGYESKERYKDMLYMNLQLQRRIRLSGGQDNDKVQSVLQLSIKMHLMCTNVY